MKLSPKDKRELVSTFRQVRDGMDSADLAAAELVASMYGIRPAEVLQLAFFEDMPPRKGPASAGKVIAMRPAKDVA